MTEPTIGVFPGGCHCAAIRFEVTVRSRNVSDCNCSICIRKGFLHLIVPKEDFHLISGRDSLSTYQFNTGTAQHKFCSVCGIHSFYIPRSHPDSIDVNVRCLDGVDLSAWVVTPFDGQNWEASIKTLL